MWWTRWGGHVTSCLAWLSGYCVPGLWTVLLALFTASSEYKSSINWNRGDTWSTFTSLSHMGYSLEGVSFIWPIGLSWIIQEYTFHKGCIVADWNRDFGNGDIQVCRVCWVSRISRWRVKVRSAFTHSDPESWWNWWLNGIMDLKRLVSRSERTGEKDWAKNPGKSCCFDKRSCDELRRERRPQLHR